MRPNPFWRNTRTEKHKGDPVAKQAETQQMNFDSQLMGIFQKQFATQTSQLNFLNSVMKPIIDAGGKGFSDADLASMRTAATDTNARQFQNAQETLQNQITQSSGGSKLVGVSGAEIQSKAALLSAEAQKEAGSQEDITSQNAQLKNQNYWNAINVLNGVAAQTNPLGYAGSATSGGNTVAGLSGAVTSANQSQLLGALGGIAGGVGTVAAGYLGCWIFASFFGWNDLRTWVMRLWLHTRAPRWFRHFYLAHGERISRTPLRWAFRPIASYVLEFS